MDVPKHIYREYEISLIRYASPSWQANIHPTRLGLPERSQFDLTIQDPDQAKALEKAKAAIDELLSACPPH